MDWQKHNVKVYDKSARDLADYFAGIGARVDDIERALLLAGAKNQARVIEIGCGDGRDAVEIVKRVSWYQGFDPSSGLLEIAKLKLPAASFVLADALNYQYPTDLDIIFAFASLLHVDKNDLAQVFDKIYDALRHGGVVYISLKERDGYQEEIKSDDYGDRMFYYYNPSIIKDIAGHKFETVFSDHQQIGKTAWFTIALTKR